MRWILRLLLAEKRLKIAVLASGAGLVLVLLGLILPFAWATKVGMWVGLPVFALGLIAALGLAVLVVVKDYKRYHA